VFKLNECVVSIESHLIDGRSRLIEDLQGERHKLVTRDGNAIDCISVDRRGRYVSNMLLASAMTVTLLCICSRYHFTCRPQHSNGDFLVICCEGNAGFYEVGMIGTPLEAGYSVLGWNHPGFGGSSVCL
jgi:hypothetical protein